MMGRQDGKWPDLSPRALYPGRTAKPVNRWHGCKSYPACTFFKVQIGDYVNNRIIRQGFYRQKSSEAKGIFMLKTSKLVACTVLFSVACLIQTSKGAFEPWASNTDPTDVPKSHVQDVTTAPFTYNITQGGTMDGKMCTTLPGVWEPYEQTWESNRSIRMENVGAANVINPWLKIGPVDFFSQQTIADSVVEGLSTDREKALAIFYFYITHRYHKGNGDNGAQGDVSQAIDVFGFNTCGNSTLCVSDLLSKVGMSDFIFSHCPGHVVPQVFFDGKYNTLDGDMATMMLLRDNHTLANELDLVRDHDLIKRVHQYGIMSPMNSVKNNEDYSQYYTWEGDTTQKLKGWNWWTMGMVLRPHEAIEWRWGHETPVKYHGDMTGNPPIVPDAIYNGLWQYAPDFKNDSQWRAGATVTNVTNKDGVLTAADRGTGAIVWQMRVPYQFVGGALAVAGDGYAFEIGFPNPKDGKPAYTALAALADFDGKFKGRTAMGNEYSIKCTLTGKASLAGLTIKNDIQMAPLAMPSMTVGNNSFTYLEHTDNRSGASSKAFEDHAQLGRKVEDTPSESTRLARLSGQRRQERRYGCGVPMERRRGPGRRRHHGLSFPAFGPSRHAMAHVSQFRQIHFKNARQRPGPLRASAARTVDARHDLLLARESERFQRRLGPVGRHLEFHGGGTGVSRQLGDPTQHGHRNRHIDMERQPGGKGARQVQGIRQRREGFHGP